MWLDRDPGRSRGVLEIPERGYWFAHIMAVVFPE